MQVDIKNAPIPDLVVYNQTVMKRDSNYHIADYHKAHSVLDPCYGITTQTQSN